MTAILVANIRSGSNALTPALVDRIVAELRAKGLDVETFASRPIADQVALTAASDYDLVVVAGGDGTIRSVAQAILPSPKPIAVLPYGTMNMLAKELGVPLDPDRALDLICAGATVARVDIGLADGEVFLHSALMGMPVRLGAHRERRRGVLAFLDKLSIALHMLATLRKDKKLTLTPVTEDTAPEDEVVATSIVTLVGEPSDELLPVPRRARVDAGYLTCFAITADRPYTIVRSILHEAVGTLEADENVRIVRTPAAIVRSSRRKMHILLDGERRLFSSPLSITIKEKAQPMLVPTREPRSEDD